MIKECRKHPSKFKEIQKECDRRKRFMYFIFNRKIKNNYYISNDSLLKSKKLFLNDYQNVDYSEPKGKSSKKKKFKAQLDDGEPDFI